MTATPLFERVVRVRIHAPTSRYDGHEGAVDAHELDEARKRDHTVTLYLGDDRSTLAYADELVVLDSTPPGGSADNSQTGSPGASR